MLFVQYLWEKKNLLLLYEKKLDHLNGKNNVICKKTKRNITDSIKNFHRAIVDDATIKLTVYHNTKNALSKGDFVGRVYVSLRDLHDYDRVHRR